MVAIVKYSDIASTLANVRLDELEVLATEPRCPHCEHSRAVHMQHTAECAVCGCYFDPLDWKNFRD